MPQHSDPATGRSYLLLIGIDAYSHFDPLHNAVKDVTDFLELAVSRYQFEKKQAEVLLNADATQQNIIDALDRLSEVVEEKDNVILYFSGHGTLDQRKRGYWLPVDAQPGLKGRYIFNSVIRDYIADIRSRHTLLIVDSCFSGSMTKQATDAADFSQRVEHLPSRWLLTSGRNELVADGKPGANSPFAHCLLQFLKNNPNPRLPVSALVQHVKLTTPRNAAQTPYGSYMHGVGDQNGEFVFRLRAAQHADPELNDWETTQALDSVAGYHDFMVRYPGGRYEMQALESLGRAEHRETWERTKRQNTVYGYTKFLIEHRDSLFTEAALAAKDRLLNPQNPQETVPVNAALERIGSVQKPAFPIPEMVFVKGGRFWMGSEDGRDNEKPVHEVELDDFEIGKYPVTFAEYDAFCEATGRRKPDDKGWGRNDRPVINVLWEDAQAYADWLTQETGYAYHLPTEAEWEYAARGGQESQGFTYAGSNEADEVAWYGANAENKSRPVGRKKANELGLHDMSGNVREWCRDWYGRSYYEGCDREGKIRNPEGPENGNYRMERGGSWIDDDLFNLRVSARDYVNPHECFSFFGFRLYRYKDSH